MLKLPDDLNLLAKLQEATTSDVDEERGSFKKGDKVTYNMLGGALSESDLIRTLGTTEHVLRANHDGLAAEIVEAIGDKVARYSIAFEDGFVIADLAASELKSIEEHYQENPEGATGVDSAVWLLHNTSKSHVEIQKELQHGWHLDAQASEEALTKALKIVGESKTNEAEDATQTMKPQEKPDLKAKDCDMEDLSDVDLEKAKGSSEDSDTAMRPVDDKELVVEPDKVVEPKKESKVEEKHSSDSITIGDRVEVLRGRHKGKIGEVDDMLSPDEDSDLPAGQIDVELRDGTKIYLDWDDVKLAESKITEEVRQAYVDNCVKVFNAPGSETVQQKIAYMKTKGATDDEITQALDTASGGELVKSALGGESKVKESSPQQDAAYEEDFVNWFLKGWNSLSPEEREDRMGGLFREGEAAKDIDYETVQNWIRNLFDDEYIDSLMKRYKKGGHIDEETEFTPSRVEGAKLSDEKLRILHKNVIRSLAYWEKDGTVPDRVKSTKKAIARYEELMIDRGLLSPDDSNEKKESKFSFMKKQDPLWLCNECFATFRNDKSVCVVCESKEVEKIAEQYGAGFVKEVFKVTWKNTDTGEEESTRVMAFDKAAAEKEAERPNREVIKAEGPITKEAKKEDEVVPFVRTQGGAKLEEDAKPYTITWQNLDEPHGETRSFDITALGKAHAAKEAEIVLKRDGIPEKFIEIKSVVLKEAKLKEAEKHKIPSYIQKGSTLVSKSGNKVEITGIWVESFHMDPEVMVEYYYETADGKRGEEKNSLQTFRTMMDEAKLEEGVLDLVGEVPGISKEEAEILRKAIADGVISNEWPNELQIVDALVKAEIDPHIVDDADMEEYRHVYLKHILLTKAMKVARATKEKVVLDQVVSKSVGEIKEPKPVTAIEIVRSQIDSEAYNIRVVELPEGSIVILDSVSDKEEALKRGKKFADDLNAKFLGIIDESKLKEAIEGFITDSGEPIEIKNQTGEVMMYLPRYAYWEDLGRGKPEVRKSSDDLEKLMAEYGVSGDRVVALVHGAGKLKEQQEDDTFTSIAKGIVNKEDADQLAKEKEGQVIQDEEDETKFAVVVRSDNA